MASLTLKWSIEQIIEQYHAPIMNINQGGCPCAEQNTVRLSYLLNGALRYAHSVLFSSDK